MQNISLFTSALGSAYITSVDPNDLKEFFSQKVKKHSREFAFAKIEIGRDYC